MHLCSAVPQYSQDERERIEIVIKETQGQFKTMALES
jgi:hypothetical protein